MDFSIIPILMRQKIKFYFKNKKIFLTVIIGLAAILRFLYISRRSIWHDEGFTMMMIKFSPWEIIQRTMRDVHPPFYYLILHYWAQFFGNSELAIRGMSALLGIGVVIFTYLIIKKLFNQEVAKIAALFTALGPFLIRYSQEARMWNLVAFLVTAATYFLLKACEDKKYKWWVLYSISMALAAYTQYFSLLVLMPHWVYVLLKCFTIQKGDYSASGWQWDHLKNFKMDAGLKNRLFGFLTTNIFIIGAFSFWVPTLFAQMSRVSSGYWIQRQWMTIRTVPSTLYQFLSYITFSAAPNYIHELILVFLAIMTIYIFQTYKEKWREIIFLLSYFLVPMYFIFAYSLIRAPIYQDRYFVWTSIAFYSFLALFISSLKYPKLKRSFRFGILVLLIFGIVRIYTIEAHGMREIGQEVTKNYQMGDEIIAGEIYAWFDFSYYNKTGRQAKIFSDPEWIKQGYGEASLIYDQAEILAVKNLNNLKPVTDRVWFVGRDPWRDYYKKIPANWQELQKLQKEDSQVILYQILK